MNKNQEEIFREHCYKYAKRFIYTVCDTTTESWLTVMCQFKWWRICLEMEEKYKIEIKEIDTYAYKIYEDIMIEVLHNRIDECKQLKSKEEKQRVKNKNVKRKVQ